MKLNVPFYAQESELSCGPTALKMVLSFFNKNYSMKLLEEKTGIKKGKGILSIQIAIASSSLGFKTKFISKSLAFNEENLKLDYYKNYFDFSESSEKLLEKAVSNNVQLLEKSISQNELLDYLTEKSIPIVLINWKKLANQDDYSGHFVPVVGYDSEYIYIHNPGPINPKAFLSVKKDVFEEARKSKGTDEDIIIISKD